MANLLQPPDLTQFTAFTSGDEHALARIYRTQYDALVLKARESLGPELAHYGGRVAQQAMLDTWEQRDKFKDVIGMTSALEAAIEEEAGVHKRKHAALHHGSKNAASPHVSTPNAEQAVNELLAELHAAPVDHERSTREVALARKHHAAEHVQSVGRTTGWKGPVALIAFLGVAIFALMRWVDVTSSEVAATKALQAEGARSLTSARGQRGTTTLSDGSIARMGSDTRLRIPADFGGAVRTLELTGTASFNVAAGVSRPFVVRAGGANITATGTQFVVRAFEDDDAVYLGVTEGSVSVRMKDARGESTVSAGQSVRINANGEVLPLVESVRGRMLGWTSDTLAFTSVAVREVLPELNRWFDLKASLADSALGARVVSLRVPLASSGEALKALTDGASLSVGFDDQQRVVLADQVVAPQTAAPTKKKR